MFHNYFQKHVTLFTSGMHVTAGYAYQGSNHVCSHVATLSLAVQLDEKSIGHGLYTE